MRSIIILLLLAAGCTLTSCAKQPDASEHSNVSRSQSSSSVPAVSAKPVEASSSDRAMSDAAPPVKDPAACKEQVRQVMGQAELAHVAKEGHANYKKAKELWSEVAEPCRDGQWYLAAAVLFAWASGPLEATNNVRLDGEEAALNGALAQPDDVDVLARVAFISALGRKPTLPPNACTRGRAAAAATAALSSERKRTDGAAYVCAREAIANGDGGAALKELDLVKEPYWFLDIELARAQAAKLVGDVKMTKQQATLASRIEESRTRGCHHAFKDRDAIIEQAKKLLSGK